MCFHKVSTPMCCHPDQETKHYQLLLETSLVSLRSFPHSSSSPKVNALQTSKTAYLFFTAFDPYRNGIVPYILICAWLLLLSVISVRFLHFVAGKGIYSVLISVLQPVM